MCMSVCPWGPCTEQPGLQEQFDLSCCNRFDPLKLCKDQVLPRTDPPGLQHGGYEAFRCLLFPVVHWAGDRSLRAARTSRRGSLPEPGIISAHLKQVAEIFQGAQET